MSQHRHLFPLIAVAVLLATACSSPRKASERACAKAEKHRARAIWLCPQMLYMDSANVRFQLPGDSTTAISHYTDPLVDSLLAACEQYAAALATERELYRIAFTDRIDQSDPALATPATAPHSPAQRHATDRIRQQVCQFKPFTATTGLCVATVRPGANGPMLALEQLPVDTIAQAPCPPQLQPSTCPTCSGVASWYRWGFWCLLLIVLALLMLIARVIVVSMRANSPNR